MRRAVSAAGLCMALLAGGCSAEPAVPAKSPLHGTLFINEFMAANKATFADEHGDFADWVELYNAGDGALDLRVMYVTDDLTRPMKWAFPDTTLPPHSYVLVWCDAEYRQGAMHTSFRLDADKGEQLGLFVTDGDHVFMIDTLSFGPQSTDTSRGRLPDGGEWRSMAVPTPGAANSSGVSALRGLLFINEFMASNQTTIPDEAGDYDDWIELYNADTVAVSLADLYMTDELRAEKKWALPDTSIAAGAYLLVWADNETSEGPLHAAFNLGAAAGEQLGLFESSGTHVLVVDTLTFGPQKPDTSYGRIPDGGDGWEFLSSPSPRAANHLPATRAPKPVEGQE
jgi:large repetitive protein